MNFLDLPKGPLAEERFDEIVASGGLRIERIVSAGHATAPGEWYDQEWDEWVLVLQGEGRVELEDGTVHGLKAGDHLHLPAHCRHRVTQTSTEPPCVWVAVHWDSKRR
ncbi:cupin domain-containing protein [bacterium]|nr:cupin domain-containing protein [bacterium]